MTGKIRCPVVRGVPATHLVNNIDMKDDNDMSDADSELEFDMDDE